MNEKKKADVWMPIWIGAYLADTMKLTTLQHGAYFLLLLAYWRERKPLSDKDEELRSITKLERADWKRVKPVLAQFFRVGDGVWWHKRVEAEMAAAEERSEKAASKASKAAEARWSKDGKQSSSSTSSNAPSIPQAVHKECPTPSPIPSTPSVKKERKRLPPDIPRPADVSEQTWADWLALRSKKNATVSRTVLDEAAKEAVKAGMTLEAFLRVWCLRGSQGLQADWLKSSERGAVVTPINRQEAIEARNSAVGDRWLLEQEAMDASR